MSCTKSKSSVQGLWALMDCNNFYASCERLFRPDIANKPVVVLSNNDGCIIARSAEAKALGIGMAEPEFKIRPFLKRHGVHVFSSNYALYGDLSQRVMDVAQGIIPHVEQYSIDEAFLYLQDVLEIQCHDVAKAVRQRVLQWTGITVSVGVAPTRTLAKLANHIAKKRADGVFLFPHDETGQNTVDQDALLAATPVQEIWGIGRRQALKLQQYGVLTAAQLRDKDDLWIRQKLTVTGLRTAMELRGIPCIEHHEADLGEHVRHTLVRSRSFGERVYHKEHLAEALTTFATTAAERLRHEKLLAGGIAVHIRSGKHHNKDNSNGGSSHRNNSTLYNETISITFPEHSDDTRTMIEASLRGLDKLFKPNIAYAKAGVMLFDLCPKSGQQGNLLHLADPKKASDDAHAQKLMQTLDSINARYGRHALHFAGQGLDAQAPWRMKQKFRSPKFTTAWDNLPVAKA